MNPSLSWNPLEIKWVKLNFDGASKGNLSPSGIRVLAILEDGSLLVISTEIIVNGMNHHVECLAIVEVVMLGIKLGVR